LDKDIDIVVKNKPVEHLFGEIHIVMQPVSTTHAPVVY
jgi:hypothetical protein